MTSRNLTLAITVVLVGSVTAHSRPVAAAESAEKKEEAVVRQITGEVVKLARACAAGKAFSEARAELKLGLGLVPEQKKKLEAELAKLATSTDAQAKGFSAKHEAEHEKAHERWAGIMAELASQYEKEGLPDRADRWVARILENVPSETALAKAGRVSFLPYLDWVRKAEAERLEAGGERIDGAWKTAAEVAELDKKHASWADPWSVSDGVHEVKTTLPYRQARQALAQVGAFRTFLLRQVGSWNTTPPKGVLPVYLMATYEDFVAQATKLTGQGPPAGAFAYYAKRAGETLNPCLVTLEINDGRTQVKVSLEQVFTASMRHEIAHQVLFEYAGHESSKAGNGIVPDLHWCVEGFAMFFQYHEPDSLRRFHLAIRPFVQLGPGHSTKTAFAWCQKNQSKMTPLAEFVKQRGPNYLGEDVYFTGTGLVYFLMEGEGGRYRAPFLRFCEVVHRGLEDGTQFDAELKDTDMKALNASFLEFVSKIQISEAP